MTLSRWLRWTAAMQLSYAAACTAVTAAFASLSLLLQVASVLLR